MTRRPLAAFVLLLALALPAAAVQPHRGSGGELLPDFDVRGVEQLATPAQPTSTQLRALDALRRDLRSVPGDEPVVHWGPQPGTLHHLFRRRGFLTGTSSRDADAVARAFVHRHRALLGLSERGVKELALVRRMTDPGTEAVHLLYEQRVEGVEIFHGEVRVHLDRRARVLSVGGDTAPEAVLRSAIELSPGQALAVAARHAGVSLDEPPQSARLDGRGRHRFDAAAFESEPWVDPTWFPHDAGIVRAWRAIVDPPNDPGWYQVVVDAATGEVLSRVNLVQAVATEGLAFREDPGQGPQVLLPFVDEEVFPDEASPLGWSEAGETRGNNCDVKDDRAADNETTEGTRAVATGPDPLSFSFPFNDDPDADLEASLTNLFYLNNWLHDRLWRMGFDEAAGNFQADNFGRGGLGGDAVRVDAQDGGGRNNANFGTPPDGTPPRMQLFIWTRTSPNRDAGFDGSVVTHELLHGVSNRLVGGADNAGCLGIPQGGAMGEAWSDFYPCSFWDQPTVGGYLVGDYVRGIRRWAYDVHPLGYGDLCNAGGFQVHRDGEIWAATLWDLRELFMARDGHHAGRCRIERLVLDGMKLSPCRPTYTDMRDAILLAARLSGDDGDECLLWEGFAARGLGVGAVRQERCTSAEDASTELPVECADCALAAPELLTTDTSAPNRVAVRFTPAPGASEHLLVRSAEPCPASCLEAEFVEVARGAGDATELVDADADGNRLSVGQRYSYRVIALAAEACSARSACDEAAISGRCTLRPSSEDGGALGVLALRRSPSSSCTLDVQWAAARAACGDPLDLVYNVYRSEDPGFVPGPEHLVASVPAPATTWSDASVPAAAVSYVVRAEDLTTGGEGPHGGNEEGNDARLRIEPMGPEVGRTSFLDDAEGGELPGYRRTGDFTPNDWAVVADEQTRGGSAWHVTGEPGGTADKNLEMPRLALGDAPRLSFQHVFDFEDDFDGGVLEISTDGGLTWRDLLEDFAVGGYGTSDGTGRSRTVGGLIHAPNTNELWTGQNASGFGTYDRVEVDLAPYAGALDAIVRFRCLLDPLVAAPGGWYVDDIEVEDVVELGACASACTDPPTAVLDDAIACRLPGEAASVELDASASLPGGVGPREELAHVLTHDGAGSFGGRRWAEGPRAILTLPPEAPLGDHEVRLTVRDADGCAASVTAVVTLEEGSPPAGPVGDTLRLERLPDDGVRLAWAGVGAVGYEVHGAEEAPLLAVAEEAPLLAAVADPAAVLDAADLAGDRWYFRVVAAPGCGP